MKNLLSHMAAIAKLAEKAPPPATLEDAKGFLAVIGVLAREAIEEAIAETSGRGPPLPVPA